MSKAYPCELCKKVFTQKIDFTRHKNKKSPCISLNEIQQINQTKDIQLDHKSKLINTFKSCLNILRDNEGLTGEKALRNMTYLLILKLIEPHFGNEIDIDNYDYDFSYIDSENVEKHKKKLLSIVRFSILSIEPEPNITNVLKYLWDDILSKHPSTKNIFLSFTILILSLAIFKILFNENHKYNILSKEWLKNEGFITDADIISLKSLYYHNIKINNN